MAAYVSDLIGSDPSIEALRRLVGKVGRSPARTVLIYGETGTGKGLVARLLHQQSARSGKPFLDVNCAAIPSSLMESELFGHERGAFTGAITAKKGLVEAAHQGSIFLDEIREMEPTLQAKLLSLLDTQQFRRVGAVRPIEVDVRFIAATNRILLKEVTEKRFREDLYYRLQVVSINIPRLRERGEDVLVLTDHFLRRFGARYERRVRGLEPTVREIFLAYAWPGNVRELENLLERIFILEEEDTVLVRHLPARILRQVGAADAEPQPASTPAAALPISARTDIDFHGATDAFHRDLISRALLAADGNQTSAAARLGLTRHALRHYMKKLDIR